MKVLVGVEDANSSQPTLRALTVQFDPKQTEVRILHVVPPITYFAPPEMAADYAPELADQMKEGRQLVDAIAKSLGAVGFKVSTAVKQGDVREGIIDSAAEWPADLIFVGSHGRKGLHAVLAGERRGVCGSACPVLRGDCARLGALIICGRESSRRGDERSSPSR